MLKILANAIGKRRRNKKYEDFIAEAVQSAVACLNLRDVLWAFKPGKLAALAQGAALGQGQRGLEKNSRFLAS